LDLFKKTICCNSSYNNTMENDLTPYKELFGCTILISADE